MGPRMARMCQIPSGQQRCRSCPDTERRQRAQKGPCEQPLTSWLTSRILFDGAMIGKSIAELAAVTGRCATCAKDAVLVVGDFRHLSSS